MSNVKPVHPIVAAVFLLLLGCSHGEKSTPKPSDNILINQIGYISNAPKRALLRTNADKFHLKTLNGDIVFTGKAGAWEAWELSGDSVRLADFSTFIKAGKYVLAVNDTLYSYPFKIADRLYSNLAKATLKSYYYARCGVDIDSTYAGKWQRKAGHPDTSVVVHLSAVDAQRPKGTVISSPGGWYDAGDYGKYIVNSGITTYTLLLSLQLNHDYHQQQILNIPESKNAVPDILDEILVNLRWMFTMQDPHDGGVYHKLTTKNFSDFVMPTESTAQRYVVQKSTAATLDFAATMAHAALVLENNGKPETALQAKKSANHAWQWALRNPDVIYHQPDDIKTGAYDDNALQDEWFWAAAEMYLLEGQAQFLKIMEANYQQASTPKWDVVQTLGVVSLLNSEKRNDFPEMESDFLALADHLLAKANTAPYRVSINEFAWGSNSDLANQGMLKLIAYRLTGDTKYVDSARNELDYLLGRNATAYCFVTGFGTKSPLHPHNRIFAADEIDEPIPGFIVGGPNTVVLNDCEPKQVHRSPFPAASYIDEECSYSTNETAINWNAPLVFLVSGLDDFDATHAEL